MKKIESIVITFVICLFIYSCNGQNNKKKKADIQLTEVDKLAAQLLYDRIIDTSKIIKNGNKILLEDTSVEVNFNVEFDGQKEGKWIYATNFLTTIKTSKKTKLNVGSIGIGNSKEEAVNVSIQEWFAVFGLPLSDMLNNKKGYEISEMLVFSGLMGIRGHLPENTWINGDNEMTAKIISNCSELIKSVNDELVSVDIKLMIGNDGVLEGECRLGNKVSIALLNKLKAIDWPASDAGYLFKQFYIVKKI